MEPNPRGGDFLPNNFVQLTLLAFEDVTGANAVKAVLNLGGLTRLVGNFPPPDSEKTFPYQDFTRILSGFEDLYGPRGGRALCHRAGEQTFLAGAKIFGVDSGEHPASLSAGMERVAWYLKFCPHRGCLHGEEAWKSAFQHRALPGLHRALVGSAGVPVLHWFPAGSCTLERQRQTCFCDRDQLHRRWR